MSAKPNMLQLLRKLAELETERPALADDPGRSALVLAEINSVRRLLPTAILMHFDQRRSRGEPPIAAARSGTCGGCHLMLPADQRSALQHEASVIHVCGHCGIFLYADDSGQVGNPAGAKKTPVAARRKKSGAG